MKSFRIFCFSAFLLLLGSAWAQDQLPSAPPQGERGAGRGERGGMRMRAAVAGQITAINGSSYVVKAMDGRIVTVETNAETKFNREQQEISPKELKVGDYVMARTEDTGENTAPSFTVKAKALTVIPPERAKQMQQMRENFGKTFTAGEVKSIEETKLTILRPDGQTQVIEADENTSFKRGQESITLADIKVGDRVMAQGEVKNGVFVPKTLRVGAMQQFQR